MAIQESQQQTASPRNNAEIMARYMMHGTTFNFLRNIENISKILMGWSSLTLEVFTRREQGEDYLSIGRFLICLLMIRMFLAFANIQTSMSFIPGISPLASERTINQVFYFCFIVVTIAHLFRTAWRNNQGIPWHSDSIGVSYFDFLQRLPSFTIGGINVQITSWMIYRWIEPCLCFVIIWLVMPVSFTRSYLLWAAFSMFVHNNLVFNMQRRKYLAIVNARIESTVTKLIQDEAFGTGNPSVTQTMGYPVMPIPPMIESLGIQPGDIEATVAETMGASEETATVST